MSADRPIAREAVAALLSSSLGHEKSDEVVATAARALGINHTNLVGDDVRAIFERLVRVEGLVGVVARYAVSRGEVEKLVIGGPLGPAQPLGRPDFGPPQPRAKVPSPAPPGTVDIMHLLVPALGAQKAREAIEHAAARRGVDVATGLSYHGALSVLDEMTKVEGLVGVVARFAKARFLLDPSG